MNLIFSHNDLNWENEDFLNFINKILGTLGYTCSLNKMQNDGTYHRLKREPIFPLVNYFDHNFEQDGSFSVVELETVLPQLKSIINRWRYDDAYKTKGLQLITGMELAITEGCLLRIYEN